MSNYYDMEVSLLGVEPRVWRRFLIKDKETFEDLHQAIQAACGWRNERLFMFVENKSGGEVIASEYEKPVSEDLPIAEKISLSSYFRKDGDSCIYTYDFYAPWEHLITLNQILNDSEEFHRRLISGARAFPIEGCFGLREYEVCCKATKLRIAFMKKPTISSTRKIGMLLTEAMEYGWDENWSPELFDLSSVKLKFDR